jgi:uncharacterized damage-inducible protein DinB
MLATTYFTAQAYNNAWANHRLLKACAKLSAKEIDAQRTSFFPSIIHTLNHNLTVDWFYVSGLEGNSVGYAAFKAEIPFPKFADLDREQRAVDRRLINFCVGLGVMGLSRGVDLVRDTWSQTETVDRVLLHVFQHQIHHRGQIHSMLAGTSSPPPQLDEFFLDHEVERKLRSRDFMELGFTEDAIWK